MTRTDDAAEALDAVERRARIDAAAKQRAAARGLAYWPALAYGPRIDPRAYIVAERVMLRTLETEPWDPPRFHGGWDSQGFHGLSPRQVAAIWQAAGCRDSRKFRIAIAYSSRHRLLPPPKRGESFNEYRAFVRGWVWMRGRTERLCRKAVAALGRLSSDLRAAALKGIDLSGSRTIRVRDLNWSEVRRVQRMLASIPMERLLVLRAALRLSEPAAARILGMREDEQVVPRIMPAYPRAPFGVARQLVLGESPQSIAGGVLSRREAHEWLLAGAPYDVADWFCQTHALPAVRSMRVARWLLAVREGGRWNTLTREREGVVNGRRVTYSALDLLDEIADEDIISGRDSVEAVLRRSAVRLGQVHLTEAAKDHRVLAPLPKWAEKLPRWVRILRTPAALAAEGIEMGHCVGGYASSVELSQCHILAIASRHGRSTVELSTTLEVRQHRGPYNALPPARHEALLRAWLRRNAALKDAVR